ncbi:MAG: hypothetical protein H6970_10940 [Gammaproteobacteria bacterium]|nr:hypothetical protein [Gammaproteobacteria bacterium]
MKETIPTWHKEALERGIDFIVIVYEKAEGFVFCPSDLEKPFRVGGDYDGNWPTNAEGAIEHFERYINKAYVNQIRWFMAYVKKVYLGEDFSLKDLKVEQRKLRTLSGRWPW